LTKALKINCDRSNLSEASKGLCDRGSEIVPVHAMDSLYHHPLGNSQLDSRRPPFWATYGDVYEDVSLPKPKSIVPRGTLMSATFWCAAPANSQMFVKSFCDVDQYNEHTKGYETLLNDHDWNVRFLWRRKFVYYSVCTCEWLIERDAGFVPAGKYRLRINGAYTNQVGKVSWYTGVSSPIEVASDTDKVHDSVDVSKYTLYVFDEVLIFISVAFLFLFSTLRWFCCTMPKTLK